VGGNSEGPEWGRLHHSKSSGRVGGGAVLVVRISPTDMSQEVAYVLIVLCVVGGWGRGGGGA